MSTIAGRAARSPASTPATVFLALLPMAHNYTLGCPGVLGALAQGGTAVIAPDTDDRNRRATDRSRARHGHFRRRSADRQLAERRSPASTAIFPRLRVLMNGGAKLAPELRRRVELRFGCTFQESFGTGEGLLNMTRLDDPAEIRFTSSGRPVSPADEIRIVDEQGNDVPDGAVGELICRGPYTVRGYYNAPEKDRAAFTGDGFYRMGDMVRRIDGNLYVEGRLKDIINRGGEKISCEEVENLHSGPSEDQERLRGGDARCGVRRKSLRLRHPGRRARPSIWTR